MFNNFFDIKTLKILPPQEIFERNIKSVQTWYESWVKAAAVSVEQYWKAFGLK